MTGAPAFGPNGPPANCLADCLAGCLAHSVPVRLPPVPAEAATLPEMTAVAEPVALPEATAEAEPIALLEATAALASPREQFSFCSGFATCSMFKCHACGGAKLAARSVCLAPCPFRESALTGTTAAAAALPLGSPMQLEVEDGVRLEQSASYRTGYRGVTRLGPSKFRAVGNEGMPDGWDESVLPFRGEHRHLGMYATAREAATAVAKHAVSLTTYLDWQWERNRREEDLRLESKRQAEVLRERRKEAQRQRLEARAAAQEARLEAKQARLEASQVRVQAKAEGRLLRQEARARARQERSGETAQHDEEAAEAAEAVEAAEAAEAEACAAPS